MAASLAAQHDTRVMVHGRCRGQPGPRSARLGRLPASVVAGQTGRRWCAVLGAGLLPPVPALLSARLAPAALAPGPGIARPSLPPGGRFGPGSPPARLSAGLLSAVTGEVGTAKGTRGGRTQPN
eukprot:CAMPEP_0185554034 /NCGR_PEP_ID=MMETSP1381-20130426/39930_1 /TAXON_ID=298111 /ORGANISM="Pavlova sp., Strain CCMP459" /LENGTH=123 /DNA_ID=CAMNT_0028167199 /DNA_START=60 /DNA_END=428 /DNA_ORIENTATION=-